VASARDFGLRRRPRNRLHDFYVDIAVSMTVASWHVNSFGFADLL
jgi:hypothetical protein